MFSTPVAVSLWKLGKAHGVCSPRVVVVAPSASGPVSGVGWGPTIRQEWLRYDDLSRSLALEGVGKTSELSQLLLNSKLC